MFIGYVREQSQQSNRTSMTKRYPMTKGTHPEWKLLQKKSLSQVESTTKIPCDYIFLVKSFVYPPSIFHTIFHTTYRNAIPTTPEIPCSFLNRIYPDLYFLLLSDFNDEKLPFCCLEYFYIFFFFSFLFFSLPWQR